MYGRWQPARNGDVRPLVNRVPDCGTRHVVVDLPEMHGLDPKTAAAIRANFHQLAAKVEQLRAALDAMGLPLTDKEK